MTLTNHFLSIFRVTINISLCSIFFWALSPTTLHAQTRQELEKQRNDIIARIEKADALLKKNASNQKASLQDLNTLSKKIKDRKKLVETLGKELQMSELALQSNQSKNIKLIAELEKLKARYYNLLNSAYKKHLSYNKWAFILNAKSLNDSFQKWRYLKQYEVFCKEAYNLLQDSKLEVEKSSTVLSENIEQRQSLVLQEESQIQLLEKEEEQIDQMLESLKQDESALSAQLNDQKAQRERLNSAIENAIIAILKGESENKLKIEGISLSDRKGNLSWPVDNGFVVRGFGKQRHPNLKNVMIENNGIDIQSEIGSIAYCVHNGEVVGINEVPGFQTTVIVKHEKYYTVYSRLEKAYVDKGQKIQAGDRIGLIYLDEQGITTLHFEIWEGKTKRNPSSWLKNNI